MAEDMGTEILLLKKKNKQIARNYKILTFLDYEQLEDREDREFIISVLYLLNVNFVYTKL